MQQTGDISFQSTGPPEVLSSLLDSSLITDRIISLKSTPENVPQGIPGHTRGHSRAFQGAYQGIPEDIAGHTRGHNRALMTGQEVEPGGAHQGYLGLVRSSEPATSYQKKSNKFIKIKIKNNSKKSN